MPASNLMNSKRMRTPPWRHRLWLPGKPGPRIRLKSNPHRIQRIRNPIRMNFLENLPGNRKSLHRSELFTSAAQS